MRDAVLEYNPRAQFLSFHARQQRWAIIVARCLNANPDRNAFCL